MTNPITRSEQIKDLIRAAKDIPTVNKIAVSYGNEVADMIEAGGVSTPLGHQIRNLAEYRRREITEDQENEH